MPTLAEFHTLVKNELNKGSSLDTYIPGKVRQAARQLEDNYEFDFNKIFENLVLTASDTNTYPLPTNFKSMIFIRLDYDDEEDYRYLTKVDPRQVTSVLSATTVDPRPVAWWRSGATTIFFDAHFSASTALDWQYNRYTAWPTTASDYTQSPTLIEKAEVALLCNTMILFGPFLRNQELHQQYKDTFADALRILTGSQMTNEQGGASPKMEYK